MFKAIKKLFSGIGHAPTFDEAIGSLKRPPIDREKYLKNRDLTVKNADTGEPKEEFNVQYRPVGGIVNYGGKLPKRKISPQSECEPCEVMLKLADVIENGEYNTHGIYYNLHKNRLSFDILSKDGHGVVINPSDGLGSIYTISTYFHPNKEYFGVKEHISLSPHECDFLLPYIDKRLQECNKDKLERQGKQQAKLRERILNADTEKPLSKQLYERNKELGFIIDNAFLNDDKDLEKEGYIKCTDKNGTVFYAKTGVQRTTPLNRRSGKLPNRKAPPQKNIKSV